MAKPDWRKAHQRILKLCYDDEIRRGWPHDVALQRAQQRATASSERSINAYNNDYGLVAKANPTWNSAQIEKEVKRLQEMRYIHNNSAAAGKIKHIRWLVDGEEVLKVE